MITSKRHIWEAKLRYIVRLKGEIKTADHEVIYAYYGGVMVKAEPLNTVGPVVVTRMLLFIGLISNGLRSWLGLPQKTEKSHAKTEGKNVAA